MKLLKGDILFTSAQNSGWLDGQIKFWTRRSPFEPPSKYSHCAIVVDPADIVEDCLIVEQTSPRIGFSALAKYFHHHSKMLIYRDRSLSQKERNLIAAIASENARSGASYGYLKILLFMLDAILAKIINIPIILTGMLFGKKWLGIEPAIFSRFVIFKDSIVCSQAVAKYYWLIRRHFGDAWQTMTPDGLLDYIEKNPDQFRRVYRSN